MNLNREQRDKKVVEDDDEMARDDVVGTLAFKYKRSGRPPSRQAENPLPEIKTESERQEGECAGRTLGR